MPEWKCLSRVWPTRVFIVGCPRSGPTLLQRMVNAHPEIAITVGNKTPAFVRKMETLHALWPAARFVHLPRIAVLLSRPDQQMRVDFERMDMPEMRYTLRS